MKIDLRLFQGTVVLERSRSARCPCGRMLGKKGKGYLYGFSVKSQFELCRGCHHKLHRRSLRQHKWKVEPVWFVDSVSGSDELGLR